MRITSVRADWLHIPIEESLRHTSDFGRTSLFDSTLVRVEIDAGITGFGKVKVSVGSTDDNRACAA